MLDPGCRNSNLISISVFFAKNGVGQTLLPELTNEDLKDLGEQSVKNTPKPVYVYRVQMAPEEMGTAVGGINRSSGGNGQR